MLDRLPDDVLITVFHYACSKPTEYLLLQSINKGLHNTVNSLNNIFENDGDDYDKDINPICKNNISSIIYVAEH